MRFINQLFTPEVGLPCTNRDLLTFYQPYLERLPLPDAARKQLGEYVSFQLLGDRVRFIGTGLAQLPLMTDFASRAGAFEAGASLALDRLAEQLAPVLQAHSAPLDAILTTTATGNLMPGLGYRLAQRLGSVIRPETLILDLANVGCTGSLKLLNLARSLAPNYRRVLLVAVELPTTLVNLQSTAFDSWQGNCTFGDGAAALLVTDSPEEGPFALAIEELCPRQSASANLELIHWDYGQYYSFGLRDYTTFEGEVRALVQEGLVAVKPLWQDETRWAIHPAGLALLVRLARPLGLAPNALQPSTTHYRSHSNMSSAGILHILNEVADTTPVGSAINLLTMGAGFVVIYGRVRRIR